MLSRVGKGTNGEVARRTPDGVVTVAVAVAAVAGALMVVVVKVSQGLFAPECQQPKQTSLLTRFHERD